MRNPVKTWIFDTAFANYLRRLKTAVNGTRLRNYLDGDYEKKQGRILGAARAAADFEQTAMIQFDSGESRSIQVQYIVPVPPDNVGEEALVLGGPYKGKVVVVRQKPDENESVPMVVSLKDSQTFAEVRREDLGVLHSEL